MVSVAGVVLEFTVADSQPEPVVVAVLTVTFNWPLVAVIWRAWAGGCEPLNCALNVIGVVDMVNKALPLTFKVTLMTELLLAVPDALTVTEPV